MVVDKLTSLLSDLQSALRDAEKFEAGNASAGTRLRKQAQAAVKGLKEVRKAVSDLRTERKAQAKEETPVT